MYIHIYIYIYIYIYMYIYALWVKGLTRNLTLTLVQAESDAVLGNDFKRATDYVVVVVVVVVH